MAFGALSPQITSLIASATAEATARANAAEAALDAVNEQQEKRVRLLVLGLTGAAALFGIYRAIVPACRR